MCSAFPSRTSPTRANACLILKWKVVHPDEAASGNMEDASTESAAEKDPWVQQEVNGTAVVERDPSRPSGAAPSVIDVSLPLLAFSWLCCLKSMASELRSRGTAMVEVVVRRAESLIFTSRLTQPVIFTSREPARRAIVSKEKDP